MKKNTKILLTLLFIMLVIVVGIYIISQKTKAENSQANDFTNVGENNAQEDLINIADCTEEFMENYFEETKELQEKNNKDNILIVTSKEKIDNTFGASNIVEAPNNQYILQYDSEEEKNNALEELSKFGSAVSVEENIIHTISGYNSWGIEKTGLDYATKIANEKQLNEVTVAIIDTGCDMELFNENYSGKIVETYNVLNPDSDMVDEDGHGTHIAGTIAEGTPSNVKILPIKVATDGKCIYTTDIIEAINYIVYYDKADVINMSFGSDEYGEAEYQAIEAANKENIISVAAAGNDNTSSNNYPAALDNTISIASVDSNLNKSNFSNYGSTITFSAPGTNILSINGTKSGTSMATPHAVSAVAILKSYNKNITLDNTINLLKRYAIDLGEDGYDEYYGYGLINFKSAEFYDGNNGDEYNVFKNNDSETLPIVKIEISEIVSPTYNYGNITNLMNAKINFYYTENDYYTKQLWELEDVEITGYEPYSYTIQTVKIKYNGEEILLTVDNQGATIGGWEYTKLEDNNISITKFNYKNEYNPNYPAKVYIPQELDGYTVTTIGDNAFEDSYKLREVILSEKVIEIGESAFLDCNKLRKVILPQGIIEIGAYAFYSCDNLKEIVLPENLEKIGESVFKECLELENIIIPQNITIIGSYTFDSCEKLSKVEIPNGLKEIGTMAFVNCISLQSVEFPDGIENIGAGAFDGCEKLKKLIIPKSLTSIGYNGNGNAFTKCCGLEEIIVDEENSRYDSRDNCNALIETDTNTLIVGSSNTKIPATVKVIRTKAFYGNEKLTKLIIPEGVEKIESNAFAYCKKLENVIIPKSVQDISFSQGNAGDNPFHGCENITIWVHKDSYSEKRAQEQGLNYKTIEINVSTDKKEYKAFDCVDIDKIGITIDYDDESEVITEGINIKYTDKNTSFRYGDTYFTVSAYNENGLFIEKQVEVTVSKAIPEYIVPSDITAEVGQKLSKVELPEGFEWMDENQTIQESGNVIYKAKYIPEDITNYEIIENIEIIVNAKNVNLSDVTVYVAKKEYKAFETVDTQGMYMMLTYDNGRIEYIRDNIDISYLGGRDSFRYGDTSFSVSTFSEKGTYIAKSVYITVIKAIPQYTIPTDITANIGQQLSEIELPEGFEWMDENQIIEDSENTIYKAKYIPKDTTNYEIVENIEIPINLNAYVKYQYVEETNEVIAKIISNVELKDTKPTWKLSADRKVYTKVFTENIEYNTSVQDINGKITNLEININQIKRFQVETKYIYNEEKNEMTAQIISNMELKDIKPTWKLSEDKKMYTKIFTENIEYTTAIQDKWGNIIDANIKVTEIKKLDVKTEYEYNSETNQVLAKIVSNIILKDTKPTWKLSEDKKIYTKIYDVNQTYSTIVESINGERVNVELNIDKVDDKGPEIKLDYIYNDSDNTIIVYMKSNEKLKNTKPTWKLSEDQITYEKVYVSEGENYFTKVEDIYGNITEVKIEFNKKRENVITGKNNIDIMYLFTSNNSVEVQVISNNEFQNTKPTWKLSEDKRIYSKVFSNNEQYSTQFKIIDGMEYNINILIDYFK